MTLGIGVAAVLLFSSVVSAQPGKPTVSARSDLFGRTALPPAISAQVLRVGERYQKAGKENVVFVGELTGESGQKRAIEVVQQLPSLARIQGAKGAGSVLTFDGVTARGSAALDSADESLVESLAEDSLEGMLTAVLEGGGLRPIGTRFRPDPKRFPAYPGPLFDIFEVTTITKARRDRTTRRKLFYFDSVTGLLHSARYWDAARSPAVRVEVRFTNWRDVGGSLYPTLVQRFEDRRRVLEMNFTTVQPGPAVAKSIFAQP